MREPTAEDIAVMAKGHPNMADDVIYMDFDAVLYPYGMLFEYPRPIEGAAEAMQMLKAAGKTIVIFSSRFSTEWVDAEPEKAISVDAQMRYVGEVLERDGIPWDFMWAEKGPAEAYFDDKAVYVKPNTAFALRDAVVSFLDRA